MLTARKRPKAYYRYAVVLGKVKKFRLVPTGLKGCPSVYDEEGVELQVIPDPLFRTPKEAIKVAKRVCGLNREAVRAKIEDCVLELDRLDSVMMHLKALERHERTKV